MSDPPLFSDPVTQALHEQNMEWLRLMREEPGWILSRLHRLAELETTNTRLREALEVIANSGDAVVNIDGKEIQPWWRQGRLYGSPRLYARAVLAPDAEQASA